PFLKRPHSELRQVRGRIGDTMVTLADFSGLPVRCPFVAFMPQWDFLDFMTAQARALPAFHLMMNAEAVDVIVDGDAVRGVRVTTAEGPTEIRADLVVGADGRHSTVRARAGLEVRTYGSPIDVLWFRCSRRPSDGGAALGRINAGQFLVTLDRGDY